MRRTHVRGKQAVHTDIGMMLMSMNLTKLALEARRKVEAFQHKSVKNKNRDETITFMIISSRFLFLRHMKSEMIFQESSNEEVAMVVAFFLFVIYGYIIFLSIFQKIRFC